MRKHVGGIAGAMQWLAIVCAVALPVSVLGEAMTGRSIAAKAAH
jgi:hypothetical protein